MLDFAEEKVIITVEADKNICKRILNKEEKRELINKIFSKFICNSKQIYIGVPNWKIAMYEFYEEESLEVSRSLLDEVLLCDNVTEFNEDNILIECIVKSVNLIQNNISSLEKGKRIYIPLIDKLNSSEILAFSNILNQYLSNTYRSYKMKIEYADQNDETTIYCFNEDYKKYTVCSIFPNDDVMKDVLNNI